MWNVSLAGPPSVDGAGVVVQQVRTFQVYPDRVIQSGTETYPSVVESDEPETMAMPCGCHSADQAV